MKHLQYAVLALLIAAVLSPLPSGAALTKTCLTGGAPEVANDGQQIRAVRALIEAACGCSTFDGSPGNTHVRYVACATTIINAQAAAGNLRTQCKRTVTAYYRNATCGRNPLLHPEPCIQTSVRTGKIICAVKATTKSNGTPATACTTTARTLRVACPTYTLCIDAADTNGNLLIAAPDSGRCTCPPGGPTVLQTGQTQCDQGDGNLGGCPGGPVGQDGSVLKGAVRSYTDNGDGTVTDNATGLMWEKLSQDGSIHDYGTIYTWSHAFTTKIATLNSGGGFAGHTDWRLPNVNELQSIVNFGTGGPAVDAAFNANCQANCTVTTCSCTQPGRLGPYYWSSTTSTDSGNPASGAAWQVAFYDGSTSYDYKGVNSLAVRAVRGGSPCGGAVLATAQRLCDQGNGNLGGCPGVPAGQDGSVLSGDAQSYTDNGDGTVTDNTTGLMWEKLSRDGSIHDWAHAYTWDEAFTTKIATLNSGGGFAGRTDWRVPNINELRSLVDYQNFWPTVDTAFNTGCVAGCAVTGCSCTHQEFYWSSTTTANAGLNAWGVSFDAGRVGSNVKDGGAPVRAVRGGL